MVKHILFWQFTDEVKKSGKKEALEKLSASVANMNGKIPGLLFSEIGENIAGGDYDFVYYSEFDSMESLNAYQTHPLHMAHKEMAKNLVKGRTVCDYIVEKKG